MLYDIEFSVNNQNWIQWENDSVKLSFLFHFIFIKRWFSTTTPPSSRKVVKTLKFIEFGHLDTLVSVDVFVHIESSVHLNASFHWDSSFYQQSAHNWISIPTSISVRLLCATFCIKSCPSQWLDFSFSYSFYNVYKLYIRKSWLATV